MDLVDRIKALFEGRDRPPARTIEAATAELEALLAEIAGGWAQWDSEEPGYMAVFLAGDKANRDAVALKIRGLEEQAFALREEERALAAKAQELELEARRLSDEVVSVLLDAVPDGLSGGKYRLELVEDRRNVVKITNPDAVPWALRLPGSPPAPNEWLIREKLDAGEEVRGATLVPAAFSLWIEPIR